MVYATVRQCPLPVYLVLKVKWAGMEIILILSALIGIFSLGVNIGAMVALSRDDTLESIQRWAQGVFVWIVPLLGGLTVLHLTASHFPQAVPRWVAIWPLKRLVSGEGHTPNSNRNESEGQGFDLAISYRQDSGLDHESSD